jgi:hypothetical protein
MLMNVGRYNFRVSIRASNPEVIEYALNNSIVVQTKYPALTATAMEDEMGNMPGRKMNKGIVTAIPAASPRIYILFFPAAISTNIGIGATQRK